MWSIYRYESFLLFVLSLSSVALSLYIGDVCYHKWRGVPGKCSLIENCQSAISDLKNRALPENCGFIRNSVIVCCPEDEDVRKAVSVTKLPLTHKPQDTIQSIINGPTTPLNSSTPFIGKTRRIPGEESRKYCEKYEALGYKEELSPLLIEEDDVVKRDICPWIHESAISGGVKTILGEFPHMALLKYGSSARCGGILISENFVLTASHCINEERNYVPMVVRLGDLNITDPNDDIHVQEIKVKQIYKHPDFIEPVQYNDIALLELDSPAILSEFVKPACLYTQENINFEQAIVTGWGITETHIASNHLLKALVDIFTEQSCNEMYKSFAGVFPTGVNYKTDLCAGSFTNNKDTCGGDSGGPLQIIAKDVHCSYYIIAVTSFGLKCGQANSPAVYTKVYPYLEWIENIVWPQ